jgi:thiamine biosynthesis lipoprotein
LVDPTLVGALEAAGYARSRAGVEPAKLADALAAAPPRQPASPHPRAPWRRITVDLPGCTVRRPLALAFDTGGTGKGLSADTVGRRLSGYERFVVDVGGDLRIGGRDALEHPYEIEVEHPFNREPIHVLRVGSGGVATSGLRSRVWQNADGSYAHHLLDPVTGKPAWTGLSMVTALAPTALEAETRSKAALLSGPRGAREWLRAHGGIAVHDDGDVELVGPLGARPQVRLRMPTGAAA